MRISTRLALRVSLLALIFTGLLVFNPSPRASVEENLLPVSNLLALPDNTPATELVEYDEFDFRKDAFETQEHKVKRNETFSDMLSRFGVSGQTIIDLARVAKPVMDVRRIRAGNTYRIYDSPETESRADVLVYQHNAVDYVVFDLRDSLQVETGSRPIQTREKRASGSIESSLYVTLSEQDANPMLAIELSEVFAWQVDFYRIMKGDHFSVVYEEEFVGDKSIGVGQVSS